MANPASSKVRNWQLILSNRGKDTGVNFGPAGADGSFTVQIYQRKEGKKVVAGWLQGVADCGHLHLQWRKPGQIAGNEIVLMETQR